MAGVVFYYDFNSPYAYLAAERIGDLIPDAEWRPIAFAIVLSRLGRLDQRLEGLDTAPIVESRSLSDLDNIIGAAAEVGLEADEITEGIQRPEIKERLKRNTDEALVRGVTGIPTVAVGDELFWGDDHLDDAARRCAVAQAPRGA